MAGEEGLYEFIDDRRADGIDKVDEELQDEDDEKERRHGFSSLRSPQKRQTTVMENKSCLTNSTLTPSPIKIH